MKFGERVEADEAIQRSEWVSGNGNNRVPRLLPQILPREHQPIIGSTTRVTLLLNQESNQQAPMRMRICITLEIIVGRQAAAIWRREAIRFPYSDETIDLLALSAIW